MGTFTFKNAQSMYPALDVPVYWPPVKVHYGIYANPYVHTKKGLTIDYHLFSDD